MGKLRVLLLTQWFDPEPTFKGLVFARELVRLGHEVEVVTGFPNYPGGRVYPGYRIRWRQREVVDGVRITRVALYPSHDQSAVGRALNYLSFAASALWHLLFTAKRADVVYAYHPPLTVGMAAAFMRLCRRIPVVYDIQDMWPDTLRATGMISSSWVLKLVAVMCDWVYRRVDRIVVLSPGFKRVLVARGVKPEKIDVIFNWCNEDVLRAPSGIAPLSVRESRKFRILFAGNMGKAQALDAVLGAAELVAQQSTAIQFVFLGGGVEAERLKAAAERQGLTNTLFLPQVPMNEVGAILRAADVLLVHLRRDPLFAITIPSKTQAYMAVGKPILMAVDGDAAELVMRANCGVVARSEDALSIAQAAIELYNAGEAARSSMASAGRAYYDGELSLAAGAARFSAIFEHLTGPRPTMTLGKLN
jgi:colanic acid biosynthesis glycosyl transferase WcaI